MAQWQLILDLLLDMKPHSNFEICEKCYKIEKGVCNTKGRMWDLKQKGCIFDSWQDKENSRKHWYQLKYAPPCYQERQYIQEPSGQMAFTIVR